jgi:hypothetical protein
MVIMFDPIVRNEKLVDELPPESWVFLAEVRHYIEPRLHPLRDKIDIEENIAGEEGALCTMVYFNPGGLRFCGYSKELTNKMNGSFDNLQRDIEFIWLKFDKIIQGWFN